MTFPWLTLVGLLPIAGSLLVLVLGGRGGKAVALCVALADLVLGVAIWPMDSLAERHSWIGAIGAWYALDADGMTKLLVLLTVILVPIVLLAEWRVGDGRVPRRRAGRPVEADGVLPPRWSTEAFMALALMLEGFTLYVFMASDLLLFYIFFEATLIPMYFLVAGWGGPGRTGAALKFLLYSLLGGLVLLAGVIGMYALSAGRGAPSLLTSDLTGLPMGTGTERWLFAAFFIAFAIKAPMVPVHTWLPDTAQNARPGTSVLLVGVLDKVGTFGMITLCLRLFPLGAASLQWWICGFAVASILWGGLSANGQNDIMRLVSYTSVSHFGFMVLGIFIGSQIALVGAMFYMVAHGVSIAAMFLLSGWLSRRGGTQDMREYVGMQKVTPVLAGLWLMSGLASIALPGLSGFVPEYLVLMGTWTVNGPLALFAVLGVVIAAMYILMPYQRVFTGAPGKGKEELADLGARERCVMTPLVIAMLVLGIWSAPLVSALTPVASDLDLTNSQVPAAVEGSAQ